jgi:hypothetical protein
MLVAFGSFFAVLGMAFVFFGMVYAAVTLLAGRFISQERRRVFCLVIAAIHCLHAPLGTALGVCTFIVLLRPSVQARFQMQAKLVPVS